MTTEEFMDLYSKAKAQRFEIEANGRLAEMISQTVAASGDADDVVEFQIDQLLEPWPGNRTSIGSSTERGD